jgi:hypothetical protein
MITVLATGSRNWRDWQGIAKPLRIFRLAVEGPITFRHGAQVSENKDTGEKWGADYIVDQLAQQMGALVDPHPADWERWGKRAGGIRNQEMIDAGGINICLAWPLGKSTGTWDCMRRAALAGIPVIDCAEIGERSWI